MSKCTFSTLPALFLFISLTQMVAHSGPKAPGRVRVEKPIIRQEQQKTEFRQHLERAELKGLHAEEIISLPEMVGFGAARPGVAIASDISLLGILGKHRRYKDEVFLKVIVPREFAGEGALFRRANEQGKFVVETGEQALNSNFRALVEKLHKEDPSFDIGELTELNENSPSWIGLNLNLNKPFYDAAMLGLRPPSIDGREMNVYHIAVSAKAEHLERLITALKEEFVLYNNLE